MLTPEQLTELRHAVPSGPNKIPQAMTLAGVTQVQIAEGTGFTQSYISRIQNGNYEALPGETMRSVAVFFGCSIEDLFPAPEPASDDDPSSEPSDLAADAVRGGR